MKVDTTVIRMQHYYYSYYDINYNLRSSAAHFSFTVEPKNVNSGEDIKNAGVLFRFVSAAFMVNIMKLTDIMDHGANTGLGLFQ